MRRSTVLTLPRLLALLGVSKAEPTQVWSYQALLAKYFNTLLNLSKLFLASFDREY